MKRIFLLACIAGFVIGLSPCLATGERLDFAVIQPGQPGSPEQAGPVMEALAAYVKKKLDDVVSVKGEYFNKLEEALRFMEKTPPSWAIVQTGFYFCEARRFERPKPACLHSDPKRHSISPGLRA